jgi:site-specific recombinase XerD
LYGDLTHDTIKGIPMPSDALARFEAEYIDYNSQSDHRRRESLRVLRAWSAHAGRDLADCDDADLRAYLSDLIASGQHPNTVRKKLMIVRAFAKWAFGVRLVDAERLMRIQQVPSPNGSSSRGVPRPYTSNELRQFAEELDRAWPRVDPKWWPRWRAVTSRYKRVGVEVMRIQIEAIVGLALYCGLRQREIFHLSIDDCHPDNAYVVVRQRSRTPNGKDKMREVPYAGPARERVRAWLSVRAEVVGSEHDSPWIVAIPNVAEGVWKRPMSANRIERLLSTVGDWQLHRFRHTAGTTWLRAGIRLELVSKLLGHASLQQTLGYAELVRDDLQRAVEKNEDRFERLLIGEDDGDSATEAAA